MDRKSRWIPLEGAAALAFLLLSSPAGGATRIASTSSAREFMAGDFRGTALTAAGRVTLGAAFGERSWPNEAAGAVVFGAALDGKARIYVATGGGQGRLYVSENGRVSLVLSVPEPNITAVAVAPDGTIVCGTSPDGGLYRVDPSGADAAHRGVSWGSPDEAAIWSLAFAPDGTLFIGTGAKGRIYRRDVTGKISLFFEAEDLHVRSLAVAKDGTLYAGTSDRGLLIAIGKDGKGRTLHDFEKPEVTAIVPMADGSVFAAAASVEALAGGGSRSELRPRAVVSSPTPTPTPSPAPPREEPRGTVSVQTTMGHNLSPAPAPQPAGTAEIVAVGPDGFVEPAWNFPEDAVYGLRFDPASGSLFVATGPRGRIYSLRDRHLRLEAQTDERVVVATFGRLGSLAAVTSSAPGVLVEKVESAGAERGRGAYTSVVRDAGRLALFGRLRFEGDVPPGSSAPFFVRAGNSQKPDGTWTEWLPVGGEGDVSGPRTGRLPSARFFQWKVELKASDKGQAPAIERVELSYADRNARPVLEYLAVLEPGAVFPRAGASSGPSVLSVTNPDENGIFAGVEPPKDGSETGRKLYRKGFRTFTWKGTDPNGDALRYDVEVRPASGTVFFPIKKEIDEPRLSIDTTALADGRYRFRVTASDRVGNPEDEALTASEESDVFVVDNTPPSIRIESRKLEGGDLVLRVLASDQLTPIAKAEGAVNADRWRLLTPEENGFGSLSERFTFRVPKPSGPAVLAIRVVDGAGNVAAASVEYPAEFRKE